MLATNVRYRIVVALDHSEYAEIVLEHALDEAARHDAVDLDFLTVVATRAEIAVAQAQLLELVSSGLEAQHAADWRTRLHVRVGDAAKEIAMLAGDVDADLLVIGRFGVHGRRSTADALLPLVGCALLVVGLTGHVVEAEPPCPRCARMREETAGEHWFCSDHASPDRLDLVTRLPSSTMPVGGGTLW